MPSLKNLCHCLGMIPLGVDSLALSVRASIPMTVNPVTLVCLMEFSFSVIRGSLWIIGSEQGKAKYAEAADNQKKRQTHTPSLH